MVALRKERSDASTSQSVYTSCFSQSTSFASAFPRCEILFFSALGISAYVWPSYSKQASQPAVLCQFIAPFNVDLSAYQSQSVLWPRRSCPAPTSASATPPENGPSYLRATLKNNRLMPRSLAIRKRANSLRRLVLEASQQFVELLHPKSLEKPLPAAIVSYIGQ